MADYVQGTAARVALAVTGGARTIREVAEVAGVVPSTVHRTLIVLRRWGLVAWESDKAGTLRPAVRVVPIKAVS
jgi:DNA-binding IclR family transcriptional regulator